MNNPAYTIMQQGKVVCIREAQKHLDSWYYRNNDHQKKSVFQLPAKMIKVILILLFLFSLYLPQNMFAVTSFHKTSSNQFLSPIPQSEIIHRK